MSLSPGDAPEGTQSISQSKTPTLLDDEESQPLEAPKFSPRRRRASIVDVGFFDPEGVDELEQSLRRQSRSARELTLDTASTDTVSTIGIKDGKPFDLERTLRKILHKREENDFKPRELGVVFRNLRVTGLGVSASYAKTLGSILNPVNYISSIQRLRHPPLRDILNGFEGVVRPGEMLLVLGRPGSGCSTFLKTLANRRQEYHAVEGDVHYDSLTPNELFRHYRGDVQYCPEDDIHFPSLTVEQTIKFAATTRTPRQRTGETRSEFVNWTTDVLTTVFGLRHARKTPVGDHLLRGVSGGEKKRVSIAESLAARSCIGAWDNSTRGLDSSTALEFVQAIRIATDTFRTTNMVSLYQAGEPLYKHFDKVCVIYEGKMAYFGPADQARQYFIGMGYEPANRQTTADFLVAVTDPDSRTPRSGVTRLPRTAEEFAQYFTDSDLGKQNRREIQDYMNEFVGKPERANAYRQSARKEVAKRANKRSPYLLSVSQQIVAVTRRRAQIVRGNMAMSIMALCSFIFQGLIVGSVFYDMPETTGAFFSRGGDLFYALLFCAFAAMAEIPTLFAQRPIVLRHQRGALYHPFTDALALTIVDIPIMFINITIFGILIYFLSGLQTSGAQFLQVPFSRSLSG
ncbi:hypothetical protein Agabi119p4_8237 [Agaricus bisporus var. burnettii]|uniref:ABC transporter domain-containing protein n=1 Tax=Agaricus bisporus var. burnettii TaxID=192524 RepID=A0A8H7C5V4_AGABI|nr:hypothetical protein Agabi119p4_8237 [Agaricus bisporus var. burnettii]